MKQSLRHVIIIAVAAVVVAVAATVTAVLLLLLILLGPTTKVESLYEKPKTPSPQPNMQPCEAYSTLPAT